MDNQDMDKGKEIGLQIRNSDGVENGFECKQSRRTFQSAVGLQIHQGKVRKNHSGQIHATVEDSFRQ